MASTERIEKENGKEINWYPPGPIARAFMVDESFICGMRGPFGSGKSVTVVMKLLRKARKQMEVRAPDGWARRRTAVIRNTYPELRTTTMNTFFAWVPKHLGHWRDAGPPCFTITDQSKKFIWEVYFVALDRPDDLKKLLGMELSDAWINEAREVPKGILDGLTGRVGRFPAIWQGGCVDPQIVMDTNPSDTDHWWYTLAEQDASDEKRREIIHSMKEAEEILRVQGFLGRTQKLMSFYAQPSGRSAQAENLANLRKGYYEILMAGKDLDWSKVYVDGDYGFVMDGLPIFPEYKDNYHAGSPFDLVRGIGIRLGLDFGLTPAATISQRLGNGCWLTQHELVSDRMGISTFADELSRYLAEHLSGIPITSMRGDPSGDAVTPEENTCFRILQAKGFKLAEKAPTQDPVRRREAVAFLLKSVIDGVPAIRVHPRCTTLRKGLSGGYHRRRLQVVGEFRYRDVPEKNKYSHVCEALEYDCVSAGEDRHVTMSPEALAMRSQQRVASSEYEIFSDD